MSIKLVSVKKIGSNKFEVITSANGKARADIIVRKSDIPVRGMPNMKRIVAMSPDFDSIWGSSFHFRKEVSQKIGELTRPKRMAVD